MKINQIILNEMGTVAGAVATVAKPMGETQKRPEVAGLQPAEKVMSGKAKKKGPYQNSLSEGKKDFAAKLAGKIAKSNKDKKDTEEKIKQHQQQQKDKVDEAKLDEDDIIVVPGTKMKRKTGFVQHGQSRVDHEVEMARSDVLATMKNAKAIYKLLQNRSEEEGIEGWVQEKLIKANDYLNAVKEYYDEKMMQEMTGGVIAGGGVGEGVSEGQNINEAYINSVNDAVDVLANLRKIAKHIEIGTPYNGNLANKYVNDVWDVYSWLENRANVYDPKLKAILKGVFDLRAQAKELETGTNSGQNRHFANQIVNTLYPLIQWIEMNMSDNPNVAESQLREKALSKAQQKFFGMAHAMQKGAKIKGASKELKDVAKSMSKGDVKDFAKTKHKGLPQHVAKKD